MVCRRGGGRRRGRGGRSGVYRVLHCQLPRVGRGVPVVRGRVRRDGGEAMDSGAVDLCLVFFINELLVICLRCLNGFLKAYTLVPEKHK